MLTQACFNTCFYIYKVEKVPKFIMPFQKENLLDLWISCHAYWKNTRSSQTKEISESIFLK